MEEGTSRRRVFSVGGAAVVSQIAMAVGGVIAARELGPSGRGAATAILAWAQMLPFITLAGLNTALTVRVAEGEKDATRIAVGSAVVHAAIFGTLATGIGVLVLPGVLDRLHPDADVITALALTTVPFLVLNELLVAINYALFKLRIANASRLIGPLLTLGGIVTLWALDAVTPASVVAVTLGGSLCSLLVAALGLPWRGLLVRPRLLLSDEKFGLKTAVAGWLALANLRLDLLIMSAILPAAQIGYYGVANNAMMPVTTLAAAAAGLLTPTIARVVANGDLRDQLDTIRRESIRYTGLAAAGGVLLAVAAPFAIPFLFGSAFEPAVALVWILIPGFVARAFASLVTAGAIGMRRAWVGNVVEGVSLAVTLALLPFLLPRLEAVGAAITSAAAYGASAITAVIVLGRLRRRAAAGPPAAAQPGRATA